MSCSVTGCGFGKSKKKRKFGTTNEIHPMTIKSITDNFSNMTEDLQKKIEKFKENHENVYALQNKIEDMTYDKKKQANEQLQYTEGSKSWNDIMNSKLLDKDQLLHPFKNIYINANQMFNKIIGTDQRSPALQNLFEGLSNDTLALLDFLYTSIQSQCNKNEFDKTFYKILPGLPAFNINIATPVQFNLHILTYLNQHNPKMYKEWINYYYQLLNDLPGFAQYIPTQDQTCFTAEQLHNHDIALIDMILNISSHKMSEADRQLINTEAGLIQKNNEVKQQLDDLVLNSVINKNLNELLKIALDKLKSSEHSDLKYLNDLTNELKYILDYITTNYNKIINKHNFKQNSSLHYKNCPITEPGPCLKNNFGHTAQSAYKVVENALANVSEAKQFYSGSNLISRNEIAFGTIRSKRSKKRQPKKRQPKKRKSKRFTKV
jgi:hypothetical protein